MLSLRVEGLSSPDASSASPRIRSPAARSNGASPRIRSPAARSKPTSPLLNKFHGSTRTPFTPYQASQTPSWQEQLRTLVDGGSILLPDDKDRNLSLPSVSQRCTDEEVSTTSRAKSPDRSFRRVPSASEVLANNTIAKILEMKDSLFERLSSSSEVLDSAQAIVDACGDAIRRWFGSLSGQALEKAIREAFDKFDTDKSGRIDREEFAKAMHFLGLRLDKAQNHILFNECDVDGSGEIDREEFSHMIKKFLKIPCMEDCNTCEATGGSNQPQVYHSLYRQRWSDDSSLLNPAARNLQRGLTAARDREKYLAMVQESRRTPGSSDDEGEEEEDVRFGSSKAAVDAADSSLASSLISLSGGGIGEKGWGQDQVANGHMSDSGLSAWTEYTSHRKTDADASLDADARARAHAAAASAAKSRVREAEMFALEQEISTPTEEGATTGGAELASASARSPEPDLPENMEARSRWRPAVVGIWQKSQGAWVGGPSVAELLPPSEILHPIAHPHIRRFGRTQAPAPLKQGALDDGLSRTRPFNQSAHSAAHKELSAGGERRSILSSAFHLRLPDRGSRGLGTGTGFSRHAFVPTIARVFNSYGGVGSLPALNYTSKHPMPVLGSLTDRTGDGRRTLALFERALSADSQQANPWDHPCHNARGESAGWMHRSPGKTAMRWSLPTLPSSASCPTPSRGSAQQREERGGALARMPPTMHSRRDVPDLALSTAHGAGLDGWTPFKAFQ